MEEKTLSNINATGDEASLEQPTYEVKGTIRFADGSLLPPGIRVSVLDKDLRCEQSLGKPH